jgi:methyl-accepting chemotaxis protein
MSLSLSIITHKPLSTTLSLLIIGSAITILVTFLTQKKLLIKETMYLVVLGVSILSFIMMIGVKHITAYLMVFYCLIIVSLYQDFRPIILSGLIGVIYTIYFFINYKEQMFPTCNVSSLFNFILYIIIFTIFLCFQGIFSEKLRTKLEKSVKETETEKKKTDEILLNVRDSINILNTFNKSLQKNVSNAENITTNVTDTFSQICGCIADEANRLSDTSVTVNNNENEIESIANTSSYMNKVFKNMFEIIENGNNLILNLTGDNKTVNTTIRETEGTLKELNSQTKQIENILTTLKGISAQTNLLALNASIEAARAGEHGKGFSVVADEVRNLAESSKDSTEIIANILKQISDKANFVVEQVLMVIQAGESSALSTNKVKEAFENILKNTNEVVKMTTSLDTSIQDLKNSSKSITDNITGISSSTEENTASVQEVFDKMENQKEIVNSITDSFTQLDSMIENLNAIANNN